MLMDTAHAICLNKLVQDQNRFERATIVIQYNCIYRLAPRSYNFYTIR